MQHRQPSRLANMANKESRLVVDDERARAFLIIKALFIIKKEV
jgi:hypothetical protein